MTPEMINNIIELNKKKAPMTFEEYYNKRFMEECKYVAETPTFRMNYIAVTTQLQNAIREMSLKEYTDKWPLSRIIKKESVICEKELIIDNNSFISDYDIIEESLDNIIEESRDNINYDVYDILDNEDTLENPNIIEDEDEDEDDTVIEQPIKEDEVSRQCDLYPIRRSSRLKNKLNQSN